eukprot:GHRR01002150.1.p1 GENE.GHRR01002150.1~~GHRR01002150.1.p1  ORF type:complete len:375 (+),score=101.36 GHRR01002150.1:344-1468(+)
MGQETQNLASNVFAWFMNVSTSVLIVFVNKVLMDPKKGFGFTYATTLCAFHFLSAAVFVGLTQLLGWTHKAHLPWKVTLYFAVVANVSISSLNLSLLVNSVGFYQIAKLLIIPFVCLVELFWMKRRFTMPVVGSIIIVTCGVAVVTVTDVTVRPLGLVVAALSVVSSGMQQILCGTIQRTHKLQSHQLLANTAPVQGAMLLLVGPFVDKAVSGTWVGQYPVTTPGLTCLLLSCAVSVAVNISQFMCLGRFSAVTFQVLGHTKTVLVLLTSWAVLHEHMSLRKLSGMALAVAGMVAYGYFNSSSGSSSSSKPSSEGVPHLKARLSDSAPLLSRSSKSAQDLPTVVTAGMKNATAEKRMTAVGSSGNVTQITVIAR